MHYLSRKKLVKLKYIVTSRIVTTMTMEYLMLHAAVIMSENIKVTLRIKCKSLKFFDHSICRQQIDTFGQGPSIRARL